MWKSKRVNPANLQDWSKSNSFAGRNSVLSMRPFADMSLG